jgi:pyrroline-5-carboxylate reductase
MKIRMIGFGRLAQSLTPKWLHHHQIIASSPNIIQHPYIECVKDNLLHLDSDVILLGIKPQIISHILTEIASSLPKDSLVISLAAGIRLSTLKKLLPKHVHVYRAMPNIAASIGLSATLLYGDTPHAQIHELFSEIGSVDWVDNDTLLDLGTILAGSGPAYLYYMLQHLQKGIVDLGMPEDLAKKLLIQTNLGATMLAQQSNHSLQILQAQVTSPKGTTAAAIAQFEQEQMGNILVNGLKAAWHRILELENR